MIPILLTFTKLSACFLALFAFAEVLYRVLKVKAEYTRKIVHIGTGMLTLLFPLYFSETWQVAVICMVFLAILYIAERADLLPSINNVGRKTAGSLLYPVIVMIVFAYYQYMSAAFTAFNGLLYFYLPILAMAIGDPVAALVGNIYKYEITREKTNTGTVSFFVVVSIVSAILVYILCGGDYSLSESFVFAIPLAAIAALTERITGGGWDNFTIPVVACTYLFVLSNLAA
jgi:phytol kinase